MKDIIALHGQNFLVIRLLEHYNYPGIAELAIDYYDNMKACFDHYNESVHAVAEKYSIPVIPVYAVS